VQPKPEEEEEEVMTHTFCHIEIPSTDLECCKKFYEAVFGWKVEIDAEGTYAMFSPGEGELSGGFDRSIPVGEGGVVAYIKVEDIPAALAKIGEQGGSTVKEKTRISPEYGFYALFKDCCGNTLGLWSRE